VTYLLAIATAIILAGCPAVNADDWTYESRTDDAGFARPVSRSFSMLPDPPDDLEIQVTWQGVRQWYAQVRYGNEASVRVTVVVDEIGQGEFILFVDRNRDRVIQPVDRIEGDGRDREFDLIAQVAQEEFVKEYQRHVRLRLGITGKQFSLGTTGFVTGVARRGDLATPIRLVDGDVNGLFADDRDRIWVDVNNDGKWDPKTNGFTIARR
jgi:hypothetical protein